MDSLLDTHSSQSAGTHDPKPLDREHSDGRVLPLALSVAAGLQSRRTATKRRAMAKTKETQQQSAAETWGKRQREQPSHKKAISVRLIDRKEKRKGS
jgi:hypothetical protein